MARASGRSLSFLEGVTHPDTLTQGGGWDAYRTLVGDMDGDGDDDLVAFDQSIPTVRVRLGTSDGSFDFDSRVEQTLPPDDWSQFTFVTGDFNGDRLQDVLRINETPDSRFYIGLAREDDAL